MGEGGTERKNERARDRQRRIIIASSTAHSCQRQNTAIKTWGTLNLLGNCHIHSLLVQLWCHYPCQMKDILKLTISIFHSRLYCSARRDPYAFSPVSQKSPHSCSQHSTNVVSALPANESMVDEIQLLYVVALNRSLAEQSLEIFDKILTPINVKTSLSEVVGQKTK